MTVSDVGDRRSYDADTDVGFDQQGYCLTQGDDGGDTVKKATGSDAFLGVNFRSTLDETDDEVLLGGSHLEGVVSVEQDGVVNMLCDDDNTYNPGDDVYLTTDSGEDVQPGVATNDPPTDADDNPTTTNVGTVARYVDVAADEGPTLVPVEITGHLGGA